MLSSTSELSDSKTTSDVDEKASMRAALAKKSRGLVPPPTAHQADILDVKAIEHPLRMHMLASCSRDGIVKIWV